MPARAAIFTPSESEIASVAFQLWLEGGCRAGSDQDDWFRAEAMLKHAIVMKWDDSVRRPEFARDDVRTEPQTRAALRWEGHWEVWEMEWGEARWIAD